MKLCKIKLTNKGKRNIENIFIYLSMVSIAVILFIAVIHTLAFLIYGTTLQWYYYITTFIIYIIIIIKTIEKTYDFIKESFTCN
jgi:hypothetical protein